MANTHITVNYVPTGNDWEVTVSCGEDQKTVRAPGLIAARDQAEQLVDEIAPTKSGRVVIHLLNGDGFAFTTAYLQARHGLSDEATQQAARAAVGHANNVPAT